jgi:hypothetical protein
MKEQEPTITKSDGPVTGTVERHPAFGAISVNRATFSGGGIELHGSDFQHRQAITITISQADLHRGLSQDWHHPRERLIELILTEHQWASFVSSIAVGEGVPCTIYAKGLEYVPGIKRTRTRAGQFNQEMTGRLALARTKLTELADLIGVSGLSGKRKHDLLMVLEAADRNIQDNLNFVAESFNEHMEEQVEKAKSEVHSHLQAAVRKLGLQALVERGDVQLPVTMLTEGKADDADPVD